MHLKHVRSVFTLTVLNALAIVMSSIHPETLDLECSIVLRPPIIECTKELEELLKAELNEVYWWGALKRSGNKSG